MPRCLDSVNLRPHCVNICAALLAAAIFPLGAQQVSSPVLDAMKAEITQAQAMLKSQPIPPYYRGSFGGIENRDENRRRQLDIDLRVGDYGLDNTREVRGEMNFGQFSSAAVPVDNDPDAIRGVLWHLTDQHYKHALEQFSHEAPEHYAEPITDIHVDRPMWEAKTRNYTAPFARYTNIYEASAFLQAGGETRWFVNTEGTVVETSQPGFHLFVTATTKASDGMELPVYESYFGFSEKTFPATIPYCRRWTKWSTIWKRCAWRP